MEEELNLLKKMKKLISTSRDAVYDGINVEMLKLYWAIGRKVTELQYSNKEKMYKNVLLERLSRELTKQFGREFSLENLKNMGNFYIAFPNRAKITRILVWKHYLELINIKDVHKRRFYTRKCINLKWSVEELKKQKESLLYERIAMSKNEEEIMESVEKEQEIMEGKEFINDKCVLDFLDIDDDIEYYKSDLQKRILKRLKEYLLESEKGYLFVKSKPKISLSEKDFYPDLLFYNRLLKSFIIMDLKIGKITQKDIMLMHMYVNYYDKKERIKGENRSIGILIHTNKSQTRIKYILPRNKNLYEYEYTLYLPTEQELIDFVEKQKKENRYF